MVASWQVPKKGVDLLVLEIRRKPRIHRWKSVPSWEFVFGSWCPWYLVGLLYSIDLDGICVRKSGGDLLRIFKDLTLWHDFHSIFVRLSGVNVLPAMFSKMSEYLR